MSSALSSRRRRGSQRTDEPAPIFAVHDPAPLSRADAATPSLDLAEQSTAGVEALSEPVTDAREASEASAVAHTFAAVKVAAPPAGDAGNASDAGDGGGSGDDGTAKPSDARQPVPRLLLRSADSPEEVEADQIAGQVASAPRRATAVTPKAGRESGAAVVDNGAPPTVPNVMAHVDRAPGHALETGTRASMERWFGHDFGHVRIHEGETASQSAASLGARAYTAGPDIVFGSGQYVPETPDGRRLLAHELTHVVQQDAGTMHGSAAQPSIDRSAGANGAESPIAVVQRKGEGEEKPKSVAMELLERNRENIEKARANSFVRVGKISLLQSDAQRVIGSLKGQLLKVADRYDRAYSEFDKVITTAREHARDQQEIVDVVVGIAIGVAVGLAFEAVATVAIVGAVGNVATKALGKWGAIALGEAVGEGLEAGGAKGGEASGLTEVAGKDLQPDGLKPEVMRLEIWKALTQLHESSGKLRTGMLDQALLMSAAEYAIGEIKGLKSGDADMPEDDVVELANAVLDADKGSKDFDKKLDDASKKLQQLETTTGSLPDYPVDEMEKDIWVLWMSGLALDSNILDNDVITDKLEALGLVDFGWYTFDSEEDDAIKDARTKATSIRERRNEAVGAGAGGAELGKQ